MLYFAAFYYQIVFYPSHIWDKQHLNLILSAYGVPEAFLTSASKMCALQEYFPSPVTSGKVTKICFKICYDTVHINASQFYSQILIF